jgi:uncharacterized membrane protein
MKRTADPEIDKSAKKEAADATLPSRPAEASTTSREADAPDCALDENVEAIKTWESATLLARTKAEEIGDWVARTAASTPVLVLHALWFGLWIAINVGALPGVSTFDPFPFPFLSMIVSLEAIFLALFVLASQNRLARQSDKRSHLDLQIDLLAEREMTAVLRLLQDIAGHLHVHTSVTSEQLHDLAKKTDLENLTDRIEEIAETPPASPRPPEVPAEPG